ncbi:MAG: hypothetical protein WCE52_18240 [Candidatus Acidiferrum sp.]
MQCKQLNATVHRPVIWGLLVTLPLMLVGLAETQRNKFFDRLTNQFLARVAELGFGLSIHFEDVPLVIGGHHGVGGELEKDLVRLGGLRFGAFIHGYRQ